MRRSDASGAFREIRRRHSDPPGRQDRSRIAGLCARSQRPRTTAGSRTGPSLSPRPRPPDSPDTGWPRYCRIRALRPHARTPRQMRIARGRRHLAAAEQAAVHRQALAERQRPRRERVSKIMTRAEQLARVNYARPEATMNSHIELGTVCDSVAISDASPQRFRRVRLPTATFFPDAAFGDSSSKRARYPKASSLHFRAMLPPERCDALR